MAQLLYDRRGGYVVEGAAFQVISIHFIRDAAWPSGRFGIAAHRSADASDEPVRIEGGAIIDVFGIEFAEAILAAAQAFTDMQGATP